LTGAKARKRFSQSVPSGAGTSGRSPVPPKHQIGGTGEECAAQSSQLPALEEQIGYAILENLVPEQRFKYLIKAYQKKLNDRHCNHSDGNRPFLFSLFFLFAIVYLSTMKHGKGEGLSHPG
jgi:hypothetical protein